MAQAIDIQEFTSSGTWTKPAKAVSVRILVVHGGDGGIGGGYEGESSSYGSGGTAGTTLLADFPAYMLPATMAVTVGAGGAGGAGAIATAGAAGGAGGLSGIDYLGSSAVYALSEMYNNHYKANVPWDYLLQNGLAIASDGQQGSLPDFAGDAAYGSKAPWQFDNEGASPYYFTNGGTGGIVGGNGGNGGDVPWGGAGGGGGGGAETGVSAGGDGGNGGSPGGGGGGGGGGDGTYTGGDGGDGADGYVLVTTIYEAAGGGGTDVNIISISGDSTAADNLEAMLDGTGGVDLDLRQLQLAGGAGPGLLITSSAVGGGAVKIESTAVAAGIGIDIDAAGGSGIGVDIDAATTGIDTRAVDGYGLYANGGATGVGIGATGATGINAAGTVNDIFGDLTGSVASVATDGITAASLKTDAITEIQAGLALQTSVDDLETRLTATRAGYLDNLSAGAVATAASVAALNNISTAQVNAEVVDVLRTDLIPDSYSADGAQPTIAQAILAIQQYLFERAVSSTTVTVRKPDGSTSAMTLTLDSATAPTSITRAT